MPSDIVRVENPEFGAFEKFNSLAIANSFESPSEGSFEVGDDGSFNSLSVEAVRMGAPYSVFVNNRMRLTGRVEMIDAPMSADQGSMIRFVVRTKLADARFASANPNIRSAKGVSIKQFILDAYSPLGLTETDFVFNQDTSRDLMTGKSSDGSDSPVTLEPIKEEQLKINPPETIFDAVDNRLRRHGLMHWDSPDGKVVVGAPNDQQTPLYKFRMFNDSRRNGNNVLEASRSRDWSGIPTVLGVFGTGGKTDWKKSKVRHVAIQAEVDAVRLKDGTNAFYRPVLLINEAATTDALAERLAIREMTSRSMSFDCWDIKLDGLSYWDGYTRTPYGIDTTCDIETSLAGGPAGAYLVHQVQLTRDATNGDTTTLKLLKRGIWRL